MENRKQESNQQDSIPGPITIDYKRNTVSLKRGWTFLLTTGQLSADSTNALLPASTSGINYYLHGVY